MEEVEAIKKKFTDMTHMTDATYKAAGNVMETIKVVKNTSIWLNNEVTIEELNKNFRSTTKMAADIEQKADQKSKEHLIRYDMI